MKRYIIIVFVIFFSVNIKAQGVDMFQEKEFIWLGIDFTGAKMIGSSYFLDPQMIKSEMFDKWNDLMIKEINKFNLQEFYDKRTRYNDLLPVKKRNEYVNAETLVTDEDYILSKKDVASICSTYTNLQRDKGLGILYVVESFDKIKNIANIYVVFLDLENASPLYVKKYASAPGGAGLRNFWAGSIHRTMIVSGEDYRIDMKKYLKFSKI
ncbi:MAG: hypothetical protein OEW67_12000 [Cyclobacteriaceae bacterium]|nr:hypothetical protein [Cyclobacteriaceae bacterium]